MRAVLAILSYLLLASSVSGYTVISGGPRTNLFAHQQILDPFPRNPYFFSTQASLTTLSSVCVSNHIDWDQYASGYINYTLNHTPLRGLVPPIEYQVVEGPGSISSNMVTGVTDYTEISITSPGAVMDRIILPPVQDNPENPLVYVIPEEGYHTGSLAYAINTDFLDRVDTIGWGNDERQVWVDATNGWTANQLTPNLWWNGKGWHGVKPGYDGTYNTPEHEAYAQSWYSFLDIWKPDGVWQTNVERTLARNTNGLLYNVDLAAITSWTDNTWKRFAGSIVLTHPQVGITCGHFNNGLQAGVNVLFIDRQNNVHTNTINRVHFCGGDSIEYGAEAYMDCALIEFSEPVHTNIRPVPVIDSDDYARCTSPETDILAYATDQTDVLRPYAFRGSPPWNRTATTRFPPGVAIQVSQRVGSFLDMVHDNFLLPTVGRDSGSVGFCVIEGEVVLLDLLHSRTFLKNSGAIEAINGIAYDHWGYTNVITKFDLLGRYLHREEE